MAKVVHRQHQQRQDRHDVKGTEVCRHDPWVRKDLPRIRANRGQGINYQTAALRVATIASTRPPWWYKNSATPASRSSSDKASS
jgi:hypothetical protein